jgi:cell fate regulator YaaT (PSP1 superfamily)
VYNVAKQRERETLVRARAIAKELNLEMKIAEAEFQADGKKVTFFYTADSRVDFRELIKVYASDFRAKVEMRQIGARQESGKVGGIGSCGRELCCSTWLTDFKTVNTTAARYQNLSINQTKLSGQCGRLKCCLNYELDTYMDALHSFPEGAEQIEVSTGRAYLQKKDIFRNLMWYSFGGSNKQYPLTIERVLEIQSLNAEGKKPDNLEAVELQVKQKDAEKTVDMGFVNDVGQLTLSSLSKSGKKKQQAQQQGKQRQQQKPQGKPQQQNKPQAVASPEGEQAQAQTGAKPQQPNRPPKPPKPQQQGSGQKPQQQARPQQQKQPQQPRPQGQQKPQQQNKPPQPEGNKDENAAPKPDRPQQQQRRKFNRPPQDRKDPGGPQKEQ